MMLTKDYETILSVENADPQEAVNLTLEVWTMVATNAWEGYLRDGRGVLLFYCYELGNNSFGQVVYIGENTETPKLKDALDEWNNATVEQYVEEYNPEEEVILVWIMNGQRPSAKIDAIEQDLLTPQAAYRIAVESGTLTKDLLPDT